MARRVSMVCCSRFKCARPLAIHRRTVDRDTPSARATRLILIVPSRWGKAAHSQHTKSLAAGVAAGIAPSGAEALRSLFGGVMISVAFRVTGAGVLAGRDAYGPTGRSRVGPTGVWPRYVQPAWAPDHGRQH